MDWIDEKLKKITFIVKRKSIKSTLAIYILIAALITIEVYVLTYQYCNSWLHLIEGYLEQDATLYRLIWGIQVYSIIIYFIVASMVTTMLFYHHKIQDPVSVLLEEARYISRGDLSVSCSYKSGDEMGQVCEAFEKMRLNLIHNNENMWELINRQRLLNAAFAHDIRTPLTVLQGYTDVMAKFYPQGKISDEKLMETFTLMQSQIGCLRDFTDTMKGLQDMETREIQVKEMELSQLADRIQKNINGIESANSIAVKVENRVKEGKKGYCDEGIIMEVVNNLVSNAMSFAKQQVTIIMQVIDDCMEVYVRDDGEGFSKKELYTALNPYYSSRKQSGGHFGIGLTVSKILCEKHGGKITLSNSIKGGAIVCANFRIL